MTHTFLNTAISSHTPNPAIYDWVSLLVVLSAQLLARHGHPDGIGDTLSEGPGGDFHTWELNLGMPSGDSVEFGSVVGFDSVEIPGLAA